MKRSTFLKSLAAIITAPKILKSIIPDEKPKWKGWKFTDNPDDITEISPRGLKDYTGWTTDENKMIRVIHEAPNISEVGFFSEGDMSEDELIQMKAQQIAKEAHRQMLFGG